MVEYQSPMAGLYVLSITAAWIMVPPTGSIRSHKLFNSGPRTCNGANQFRVKVTATVAIISHGSCRDSAKEPCRAAINKPACLWPPRFIAISLMRPGRISRGEIETRLSSARFQPFTLRRSYDCAFVSNWHFHNRFLVRHYRVYHRTGLITAMELRKNDGGGPWVKIRGELLIRDFWPRCVEYISN